MDERNLFLFCDLAVCVENDYQKTTKSSYVPIYLRNTRNEVFRCIIDLSEHSQVQTFQQMKFKIQSSLCGVVIAGIKLAGFVESN